MSFWIIFNWVCVAFLTGINIVLFIQLKKVSEQVLKGVFPSTKNMGEAFNEMQKMMQGIGKKDFKNTALESQLKATMDFLQKSSKK